MLFNPNRGAAGRRLKILAALLFAGWAAFWLGLIYVAVHFIAKFW